MSSSRPSPRLRGDLRGVGKAVREAPATHFVDSVDLVQHELDGERLRPDLLKHVLDGAHHLVEPFLADGGVSHVEHHVGHERLFQRRGEALDELMREPAEETRPCR